MNYAVKLMNAKLLSLFLLFFGAGFVSSHEQTAEKRSVEMHDNIFDSSIYASYYAQLNTFVAQQLMRYPSIAKLLSVEMAEGANQETKKNFLEYILAGPKSSCIEDKKTFHQGMVGQLRQIVSQRNGIDDSSDLLEKEWKSLIDKLLIWIYTGPDLRFSNQLFFYEKAGIVPEEITAEKFCDVITNTYRGLRENQEFGGLVDGAFDTLEDPHFFGDVSSRLFMLASKQGKRILFIRTPNTVQDLYFDESLNNLTSAKVNEEFLSYIQACEAIEHKHLYINLQYNFNSPDNKDSDGVLRSKALENADRETPQGLAVVSLDKNSNFYRQNNEYEFRSNAEEFKNRLYANCVSGEGYYWTKHIDVISWQKKLLDILEEVHSFYFDNRSELSCEERRDFIELAYIKVIDTLIESLQPDSVNITCHVSIDRAPSTYVLYYLSKLLESHEQITSAKFNELRVMLLAPSLCCHNRPIVESRVNRFVSTAARLLDSAH